MAGAGERARSARLGGPAHGARHLARGLRPLDRDGDARVRAGPVRAAHAPAPRAAARGPCGRLPAMSWEPELEELRRREALARDAASHPDRASRVERQHAAGKLTVRERIERLLDPGSFHETGALAGVGGLRRGRRSWRPSCRPTWSSGRARRTGAGSSSRPTTSRSAAAPPTPRSGRRWSTPSGWRTTCGCRSRGSSTGRAAAARSSRSSRWATPTCRSCPGWRSRSRTSRSCRSVAAALGPVAGLGARAWSPRTSP